MKHTKLIIAASLIALAGCKKVMEIKETDIIAGDKALQTVENCESGVIGAYASLSVDMDVLANAVLSDEVKVGEFYNSATVHEWQFSSSDVTIRDNFTAITSAGIMNDRVNRVLRALPKADSIKAGDNVLRSKVKGEALFLRAYAHFQLFRYYCRKYDPNGLGMPFIDSSNFAPMRRIRLDSFMTRIKADLVEAKPLVPARADDKKRANKSAVAALQARVALYMREWADAEKFATEYIDSIPLSTQATFPGIWTDANQEEQAFYLIKTSSNARLGSLWKGPNSSTTAAMAQVTWFASTKLWDSYDKVNDIRFAAFLKDEPKLSSAGRNSKLIAKYRGGAYGTSTENVANAKVFRTAEMVLIRAEARAELGKISGANSAESDLNLLRTNRIKNYVNEVFASKDAVITAIMNERAKELAYEGHRYWDLKRRSLPVTRPAADAPSATSATLSADNVRFTLPIPLTEIQANRLMEQDPGYTN
ncbi:RagB/SusD family nutrient uptake outer membrane protein [Chitinophaga lutea]